MHKRSTRILSTIFALIFLMIAGVMIKNAIAETSTEKVVAESGWEPFSVERIAELQKKGIPVLVDFTARWCLICQTNHLVFMIPEVSQKMEELGVVKMIADWTKSDPKITQALKEFGRNSVPLYLLYGKDSAQPPHILPQVLTIDSVMDYLNLIENPSKNVVENDAVSVD